MTADPEVVTQPVPAKEVSEDAVEAAAKAMHDAYEDSAPAHDYETRLDQRVPWEQLPPQRKAHMRYATHAAITAALPFLTTSIGAGSE